jgi:hypothetical protein
LLFKPYKMEANEFIVRLKASGGENDLYDLKSVIREYDTISTGLDAKHRGSFALNVLCILCR